MRAATIMRPEGPSFHAFRDVANFDKWCDGPVGSGPGSFIAAPREVVNKLRGWDEAYVGYGSCDHDWIERLEQVACKVVNIGKTDGAFALHQNHRRMVPKDVLPFVKRNRELFARTKAKDVAPIRNLGGWGGKA